MEAQETISLHKLWSSTNCSRMAASGSSMQMVAWYSIHLMALIPIQVSLTGSVQWMGQLWKTSGHQSTLRTCCPLTQDLDTTGMDNHGLRETGQWTWLLWKLQVPEVLHPKFLKHKILFSLNLITTTSDKLARLLSCTIVQRVVRFNTRTLISLHHPLLRWIAPVTKSALAVTNWSLLEIAESMILHL